MTPTSRRPLRAALSLPALLGLTALTACEDLSEQATSGASEPMQVRDATFHSGELPEDPEAAYPAIVYASGVGSVVTQGHGNISYKGLSTADAVSVAVTFPTVSSGYWVLPVQSADVTQDDGRLFSMTIDFTAEVPYGLQTISFVAFDEDHNVGPRYDATICILPESSDGNLAACTPDVVPQNAVLSLAWDTDVDLDLVVITPEGKVVSSKSPTTVLAEGELTRDQVNDPTTGTLSRDSNKNCLIDSINLESLVFPGEPPPGEYRVYASLFSDCGQSNVNFNLALFRRVEGDDGTWPVERTDLAQGQLLSGAADAGESLGTYVTTVSFP